MATARSLSLRQTVVRQSLQVNCGEDTPSGRIGRIGRIGVKSKHLTFKEQIGRGACVVR